MYRDSTTDRFREAWSKPNNYPHTLLRKPRPCEVHRRAYHHDKLVDDQGVLFYAKDQKLNLWEVKRDSGFSHSTFTTVDGLRKHLDKVSKDPPIRHAFLESADSRSPLNCSPEMLKTILTYHQTDDSFLDTIYAFGDQDDPKDVCLSSFRSDDTLTTSADKLVAIPELGRSGRELRVSYLLRSVEPKKGKDWKWQIRQAAVYHSFDTETGRAFWLTVKGNDSFETRIKQSSPYLDIPYKNPENHVASYFEASLETHLVCLSWCDENWRQFIDEVEDGIREILEHARQAPIDDDLDVETSKLAAYPKSLRNISRNSTIYSKPQSKTSTGLTGLGIRKQSTWEVVTGAQKSLVRYLSFGEKNKIADEETGPAEQNLSDHSRSEEALNDAREVLNEFRFADVQTLYTFSDRIHRAILTLKLNISVVEELHDYFSGLLTSDIDKFSNIKNSCRHSLADFLREVKSISRRLETKRSQLQCLATLLREGNTLYDGILQYRQLDIGQRFQETARESADQMQIIANKTKLETASMHIITVVTMIFLPATFVATFFQSGVFLWNNDTPDDMTNAWRYRPDGLNLFVWFSIPLTAVTLGTWLVVMVKKRRKMKNAIPPPPLPPAINEKAKL